jgi:hypothetical protein
MSHRAMTWALAQTTGSCGAKAVLMNLADRCSGDEDTCFPGQRTIAAETEQSERSVRAHLVTLEALGLLNRTRRSRPDGTRTSDLFTLRCRSAPPAKSAGGEATSDGTTGKSRQDNRQLSPRQPATVAGHEPPEEPTTTTNPPLASLAATPSTRGTRLPDDWMPPPALVDEMRAERPGVDLRAEHRKFVDYWISQPGRAGVKVRWDATWRNWIRNARVDGGGMRVTGSTSFRHTTSDDAIAAVEALRIPPAQRHNPLLPKEIEQ